MFGRPKDKQVTFRKIDDGDGLPHWVCKEKFDACAKNVVATLVYLMDGYSVRTWVAANLKDFWCFLELSQRLATDCI